MKCMRKNFRTSRPAERERAGSQSRFGIDHNGHRYCDYAVAGAPVTEDKAGLQYLPS